MNSRISVRALWISASLLVSGPVFGETCGSFILEDGFETPTVSTYNDPSISGATDDGRNFTRVESTGLDWLDLNLTFNLSVNTVNQRIANPVDELYGLRYATAIEFQYLLLQLIYQLRVIGVVDGVEHGKAFIENFGEGINAGDVHFVIGFHSTTGGGYVQQSVAYDCPQDQSITAQGALGPNDVSQFAGSFLVRAIP